VYLDGNFSNDSDGNPLTYKWTLTKKPSGSKAILVGPTTVNPTFTADKAGDYSVQLLVNDRIANSLADTVVISTANTAPVADAGINQSAAIGSVIQLDGSNSSDINGDRLTYRWQVTARPTDSQTDISSDTAVKPTIKIDKAGIYAIQLIVNDGKVDSTPTVVLISTTNSAPRANAGADQVAVLKKLVSLDGGSSTDVDGEALIYSWSLTSKPAGSVALLKLPTTVTPTFTVDKAGTYVAQLIVRDVVSDSAPDTVIVTTLNSKPVAKPGSAQSAALKGLVNLDGSKSTDANGDLLTYRWSLSASPAGSVATLANATQATPSFTADKLGDYVVQLIVNDGKLDSDPKTVRPLLMRVRTVRLPWAHR
jgi:hypothetical protein